MEQKNKLDILAEKIEQILKENKRLKGENQNLRLQLEREKVKQVEVSERIEKLLQKIEELDIKT